jgi:DNA (cytosine-5)-methyltransferase 1
MKLNFIDLFSGAGGLSCGLELAGLNCLIGIDFLKPAIETFNLNHKNSIGICGDIQKIKTADIKKQLKGETVHLICGGPPCQGFSTIGKGDANDSRNHLFLDFVRFVKDFNPNYVLIENVTGLLANKNRNTLESIFKEFKKLGYELDIRVLSSNHYGVPEVRRRVIILGNNQKCKNYYPDKEFANHNEVNLKFKPCRTVGWAFDNKLEFYNKKHNHDVEGASIKSNIESARIQCIPEGKSIRYERDELAYLIEDDLKLGVNWKEMSEKRFREAKYARLDRSKPSPTIVTNRKMYYHPTENRYLTAREAAALQSFPPKYKFAGPLSKQWTQIGNAVPPLMAEAIGKSIIKTHQNKRKKVNAQKIDIDQVRSYAFKYDKDTHENASSKQLKLKLQD